jgi:hypothetical protein
MNGIKKCLIILAGTAQLLKCAEGIDPEIARWFLSEVRLQSQFPARLPSSKIATLNRENIVLAEGKFVYKGVLESAYRPNIQIYEGDQEITLQKLDGIAGIDGADKDGVLARIANGEEIELTLVIILRPTLLLVDNTRSPSVANLFRTFVGTTLNVAENPGRFKQEFLKNFIQLGCPMGRLPHRIFIKMLDYVRNNYPTISLGAGPSAIHWGNLLSSRPALDRCIFGDGSPPDAQHFAGPSVTIAPLGLSNGLAIIYFVGIDPPNTPEDLGLMLVPEDKLGDFGFSLDELKFYTELESCTFESHFGSLSSG